MAPSGAPTQAACRPDRDGFSGPAIVGRPTTREEWASYDFFGDLDSGSGPSPPPAAPANGSSSPLVPGFRTAGSPRSRAASPHREVEDLIWEMFHVWK